VEAAAKLDKSSLEGPSLMATATASIKALSPRQSDFFTLGKLRTGVMLPTEAEDINWTRKSESYLH